jgi:hypothetical protein
MKVTNFPCRIERRSEKLSPDSVSTTFLRIIKLPFIMRTGKYMIPSDAKLPMILA